MIMKSVSLQTPVVDVKDRDGSRILLFLINLQCDYSIGPKRFKNKLAVKSLFANPTYSFLSFDTFYSNLDSAQHETFRRIFSLDRERDKRRSR
jgi:hypothetical protein